MSVPYGEWPSPITPEAVVAASVSLGEVLIDGPDICWSELRPSEGGRVQVVRRTPDGENHDVLPEGFSARTRVHEYGGGAWLVDDGWLYFANWADQRLHRLPVDDAGAETEPITPEPPAAGAFRYADIRRVGPFLVCVRERHDSGNGAVNEIVALSSDGSGEPHVLVTGPDFVANPRISPRGDRLAWIQWDHPNMPWDSTELCVAPIEVRLDEFIMGHTVVVAGGPGESVIQPLFRGDGTLHFLSDRTDWWNAYTIDEEGAVAPETQVDAEIGTPQWVFGMSRYDFLADGRMVFAYASEGLDHLAVRAPDGTVTDFDLPYTEIASVAARQISVVFVGAASDREPVVVEIPVDGTLREPVAGEANVLRPARDLGLDPGWFSSARPVSFPSGREGGRTAHGLYYPPTNPDVEPRDETPPLLVLIHGGPTGMARARLDLAKQYWTSRGFALVDVNYGGSTGYGRPYRDLLQGNWGVVDVEDCVAAATWLADQGLADPARLCIRGGSAGGFTVLAALVQTDAFAAGACSYGVADLTALAEETHKFESRYLDGLVGPYPEAKAVYDERSPINHVDRLDSPLIVFQGLEDEIVPPNQSEMVVEALREKGVPVAYLAFEGEQHGFRKSETVITVLGYELAFYGRVLGFDPPGDLPDVTIDNLGDR